MSAGSTLARVGHASHVRRCLIGLPSSQVELDPSRVAAIFYCLGSLDILGVMDKQLTELDRQTYKEWLWEQQTSGSYGAGFRPSPYVTPEGYAGEPLEYETPHLVMTYTALLCLTMLRDDFTALNRSGIIRCIRACQQEDGSFSALPTGGESDLRMMYCAFVISSLLDDWSGIDLDRAIAYIERCYSYEGGYGQTPNGEALGGTSYCAIASLYLAPNTPASPRASRLAGAARARTIRWLVQNQTPSGGFSGRTGKPADACYCFWCGAALNILGAGDLVDRAAMAAFLAECQFKFGGIAKAPGERPDPYHTYLSLAILAILPVDGTAGPSWKLAPLNTLWNATEETAMWAREHIPAAKA
ncbi:terpenoid cyclases/Protein prenyltransferase [Epithele typhae]|uniref:terpenoid cyclases/Protein prenyltransferase n=1 Tax=Epithele typhae TaxID=378194 RepID=UPI00200893B0|nr:terpenoid cyclases/Protein prenyltransferase [Epithele typhae]KAH9932713.1 terpenoid cyclases/Protein prenyltransferase [Epithele typhae]